MASPELQMVVQMLRSRPAPANPTVAEMRAGLEQMVGLFPPSPDVRLDTVVADTVPAEWIAAGDVDERRTVLYLHGGGYVVGSINTHRDLAARVSRECGARVLLIDYRLAPEHPHPAAV